MEGRKAYQVPTIEVVEWDKLDIITSSFDKAENDIFTDTTGDWI